MEKQEILEKIKESKKYKNLSEEIIEKEINKYLIKNKEKKINKKTIKEIKAILHRLYASYQTNKKGKRDQLLEDLKIDKNNIETINKIFSTNRSTKERLSIYFLRELKSYCVARNGDGWELFYFGK